MTERILLVGFSRAGSHVAAALVGQGATMVGVVNRTPLIDDRRLQPLGVGRSITIDEAAHLRPTIVLLAVADDAIPAVATDCRRALAHAPSSDRTIVLHLSGSLDQSVLGDWAAIGAEAASVHPVRSFATHASDASGLVGVSCGIETKNERTRATLAALFESCGAKTFRISEGKKAFYHMAAVLASNASLAVWDRSIEGFRDADLSPTDAVALLESLVRGTLANLVKMGPEAALTGPVVRGDLSALKRHFSVMGSVEDRRFYVAMTRQTLSLARRAHPERASLYAEIERFLASCE